MGQAAGCTHKSQRSAWNALEPLELSASQPHADNGQSYKVPRSAQQHVSCTSSAVQAWCEWHHESHLQALTEDSRGEVVFHEVIIDEFDDLVAKEDAMKFGPHQDISHECLQPAWRSIGA